jgi:replicative DNA helicase
MRRLHFLDAERALLAAVLLGGDAALDRIELDIDDLYDMRNRAVLAAMRALRARGAPAGDIQLIEAELGPKLEAVGGLPYLSEVVVKNHGNVEHIEHYVSLVREASLTRAAIAALAEAQASELGGKDLLAQILEIGSQLVRNIQDPSVPMRVAIREAFALIADSMDGKTSTVGMPTGFADLDSFVRIKIGVATILAGRPSMGKSALARSIAAHINLHADAGVHVFTPEDTRRTYALRQLSDESRIGLDRLMAGTITRGDFQRLHDAASELWKRDRWLIDDSSGIGSEDIALRVRKHRRENQTKLVVVDYIQLLREKKVPLHERRLQVEIAAENLVQLARSEDLALLVLSQLSRECEKREDKRPMLSDLRETGVLEQHAEAVMFVYRDEVYHPDTERRGVTEVLVRKNKNGRQGVAELLWDGPTATHRTLARRPDEQQELRYERPPF